MRALIVAAGGGGDAITGSALLRTLELTGRPNVMTYSWDRLMVDPLPGPRTAADFTGLRELAPGVVEVLGSTRPIPPAGSSLPRLAAELPARLLLLDPARGAVGMADQISAAAAYFRLDEVALVDVGGDALTDGTDPDLRSPLADQLALAACVRADLPARLLVAGPGLDGELPHDTVVERLNRLDAVRRPDLDAADVRPVRHVFDWHPSEASGLLVAAANGLRGVVEVRDAGDQVALTASTTTILAVDAERAAGVTPAAHLTGSTSLVEAEHVVREKTGISEIEAETRKAARHTDVHGHEVTAADLATVDRHAAGARERGADFISTRRLAELVGARTLDGFAALCAMLLVERPDCYEPSVYRTSTTS